MSLGLGEHVSILVLGLGVDFEFGVLGHCFVSVCWKGIRLYEDTH